MSHRDDVVIAKAVLAGCVPTYFDYGHPERARARNYWSAPTSAGRIAWGHTRAECAWRWLRMEHLENALPRR